MREEGGGRVTRITTNDKDIPTSEQTLCSKRQAGEDAVEKNSDKEESKGRRLQGFQNLEACSPLPPPTRLLFSGSNLIVKLTPIYYYSFNICLLQGYQMQQ